MNALRALCALYEASSRFSSTKRCLMKSTENAPSRSAGTSATTRNDASSFCWKPTRRAGVSVGSTCFMRGTAPRTTSATSSDEREAHVERKQRRPAQEVLARATAPTKPASSVLLESGGSSATTRYVRVAERSTGHSCAIGIAHDGIAHVRAHRQLLRRRLDDTMLGIDARQEQRLGLLDARRHAALLHVAQHLRRARTGARRQLQALEEEGQVDDHLAEQRHDVRGVFERAALVDVHDATVETHRALRRAAREIEHGPAVAFRCVGALAAFRDAGAVRHVDREFAHHAVLRVHHVNRAAVAEQTQRASGPQIEGEPLRVAGRAHVAHGLADLGALRVVAEHVFQDDDLPVVGRDC